MKSLDQIYRYTSDCQFSDEDWQLVLAYSRKRFKGGKIHKAQFPKGNSTYQQFLVWEDEGFASGSMVAYGNTMGVVGYVTPEKTVLAAYCDYDGNLIINDMEVLEPKRLSALDDDRKVLLRRMIFERGLEFYVRHGKFEKLYTPQKYFYVTIDNPYSDEPNVGMYLESDGSKHHFLAYLNQNDLIMDCWIDSNYTPLHKATHSEIRRLHSATSKAGLVFNERFHQFIKVPKKGHNNVYWYLNDRFELVMDRDNGAKKHAERLKAGNYILDPEEGALFMKEVKKLRGKA